MDNIENLYTKPKEESESLIYGEHSDVELKEKVDEQSLINNDTSSVDPIKSKSKFLGHVALTIIIYIISYALVIGSMILAAVLYYFFPTGFDTLIEFLKFKILLIILAIIKIAIALGLVFVQFFDRGETTAKAIIIFIIYALFVVANSIFGAFVGLYLVNRENTWWWVPLMSIIVIMTTLYVITSGINAIMLAIGRDSQFGVNLNMQLKNGTRIFRVVLFLFSLVIISGALGYFKYKFPTLLILIMMGIILFLLYISINYEFFNEDLFWVDGGKTFSRSIQMAFYLFVISTDIIFVLIAFLPAIGLPSLVNPAITGLSTSGKANQEEVKNKEKVENKENVAKRFGSNLIYLLFD